MIGGRRGLGVSMSGGEARSPVRAPRRGVRGRRLRAGGVTPGGRIPSAHRPWRERPWRATTRLRRSRRSAARSRSRTIRCSATSNAARPTGAGTSWMPHRGMPGRSSELDPGGRRGHARPAQGGGTGSPGAAAARADGRHQLLAAAIRPRRRTLPGIRRAGRPLAPGALQARARPVQRGARPGRRAGAAAGHRDRRSVCRSVSTCWVSASATCRSRANRFGRWRLRSDLRPRWCTRTKSSADLYGRFGRRDDRHRSARRARRARSRCRRGRSRSASPTPAPGSSIER